MDGKNAAGLSSVKSADRVLRIIEFLAKRRNPTPTMIIATSAISRNQVHTVF